MRTRGPAALTCSGGPPRWGHTAPWEQPLADSGPFSVVARTGRCQEGFPIWMGDGEGGWELGAGGWAGLEKASGRLGSQVPPIPLCTGHSSRPSLLLTLQLENHFLETPSQHPTESAPPLLSRCSVPSLFKHRSL